MLYLPRNFKIELILSWWSVKIIQSGELSTDVVISTKVCLVVTSQTKVNASMLSELVYLHRLAFKVMSD